MEVCASVYTNLIFTRHAWGGLGMKLGTCTRAGNQLDEQIATHTHTHTHTHTLTLICVRMYVHKQPGPESPLCANYVYMPRQGNLCASYTVLLSVPGVWLPVDSP